MNDATGQPIELGKTYGYTTSSNGWTVVVIGKARKIRPGDAIKRDVVTLDVVRRQTFLYGEESDHQKNTSKTVTIAPFHLFPVPDWTMDWLLDKILPYVQRFQPGDTYERETKEGLIRDIEDITKRKLT